MLRPMYRGKNHLPLSTTGINSPCQSNLSDKIFTEKGAVSLIHKKALSSLEYDGSVKKRSCNFIYGTIIALSIAGFWLLFTSGCLEPLYNIVPENIYLLYALVYGGALLCGISFVSPFWIILYDLMVTGPAKGSKLATWLQK